MAKWLIKSEPSECGINDFARDPAKVIPWDGVRNYQARNFLAQMQRGDELFLYHSSCKHIGIAGIVRVVQDAYPDPLQFDPDSKYFDPKSSPEKPRWQAVDMQFVAKLPTLITLDRLKALPELADLALVRKGNRLSVMPVTEAEWHAILGSL
ncbi:EVE domain-containing protein [Marinobacter sp. SS21]|uniref:EVE domain-containing protein n=1 Tax=Marinobacter sp. SS21 TaxID=2979460 RepID=UPI00232C6DA2|nr:EVE domain-containing protein [Marinobacter sp. SS21]MDC0663695.1 EVE domain-containing protein [Marinobacter sp. SS21]